MRPTARQPGPWPGNLQPSTLTDTETQRKKEERRQQRREKEGSKNVELQADFCFLSQAGEVSLEELERAIKILSSQSLCQDVLVVIGSDGKAVQRQLKEWLDHFGLLSKKTSVLIRTDAEISVGELIGKSVGTYNFMVRRAGPQQHRSIGSGERGVREIKESLSVNGQRLDIAFLESGLTDCLIPVFVSSPLWKGTWD